MTPLDDLKEEYRNCQRCPTLCKSRTQVVFGSGNPHAQILFIGEAPGATEDREGIPFCGAAGRVLTDLLHSIGLSRDDVFITNTILCRPENNRNPTQEEVRNCSDRLDQVIKIILPKVIVTIGNFATERILNKKGITALHGKPFHQSIAGIAVVVVPVIHPANYLYQGRNPVLFQQMQHAFGTIATLLKEKTERTTLTDVP